MTTNQQSAFAEPQLISQRLGRLVENQLSSLERKQPSCSPSIDGLVSMVENLSDTAVTCSSILSDVQEHGQGTDPYVVLKEIENALTWHSFVQRVEPVSPEIDFLFRAHRHTGKGPPLFAPGLNLRFDLDFQRCNSVADFATMLAEHLGKTQSEKQSGVKFKTPFLSLSPILEWTLHTTGQKWLKSGQDKDTVVGLAIFDARKLQESHGTSFYRVSHILDFLDTEGKGHLIAQDLQRWAKNCDEYIAIGEITDGSLINWVEWTAIKSSPMIQRPFLGAYTLGMYRKWVQKEELGADLMCQNIISFGKLLAGPKTRVLSSLIDHILEPGISFWGFQCDMPADDMRSKLREELGDVELEHFSELQI